MTPSAVAERHYDSALVECPHPATENPWRKSIQGMSFPRSGHHLLIALLRAYFGPSFNYCEYYTGCRCSPCRQPLTNLQKNHDLGLKLPPNPSLTYLVQIRHPWPAIVSHYRMRLDTGAAVVDSAEAWEAHFRKDLGYYRGFMEKWVRSTLPSRQILRYDQLLHQPMEYLEPVIRLFDDALDPAALENAVASCRVGDRQSWKTFPYSAAQFLAEAESANILNLPVI